MQTKVARITDIAAQQAAIEEAGKLLRQGQLVAFPTETVYGLGANGLDGEACADIYAAKGRPSDNPLILHVADMRMVGCIARDVPELAEKILAAFCPGPITLVLRKKKAVPLRVTGGLGTVGIRMPDNDIARAMIQSAGCPIAAPSANLSGRPSPTTADAVLADLGGRIPLILDGGPCRFGLESTIVDCTGKAAVILRPGAITREMLEEVVGEVRLDPALAGATSIAPKAPGMKYTHYAPKAPLTLVEGNPSAMADAFRQEILRLRREGKAVGIIVSAETASETEGTLDGAWVCRYGRRGHLREIAANLYEALRSFDLRPADALLAEGVPEHGLGLAIMNRLRKASGFRSIFAAEKT